MVNRSRRWTWTLNNPTLDELLLLEQELMLIEEGKSPLNFLLWGEERGEEGTYHLQGYAEFCSKRTLSSVKELLGTRMHLEISRGSGQENIDYCSKDGLVRSAGQLMKQGSRSDLLAVVDSIKKGSSVYDLWNSHPVEMIKFNSGLMKCYAILKPVVPKELFALESFKWVFDKDFSKSIIFWGPPGLGKTCFAQALLPKALFVSHMDQLMEYNGELHDGIIFDDMDFKHFPRTAQIHLVDQEQERAIHCRYHHAMIPANTKKIFTTNEHNGSIFLEDGAIERRIRKVNLV